MSILDDDSFESYFNADASPGSAPCNDVKGRYDSCFFKSYSESGSPFLCQDIDTNERIKGYQRGEAHMEKCESLFNEYRACLNVSH